MGIELLYDFREQVQAQQRVRDDRAVCGEMLRVY
jgi:hypothetical protein